MVEHEPQTTTAIPFPWYSLACATCSVILLTVEIVPDDEPVHRRWGCAGGGPENRLT
jgi:hypothetical protein